MENIKNTNICLLDWLELLKDSQTYAKAEIMVYDDMLEEKLHFRLEPIDLKDKESYIVHTADNYHLIRFMKSNEFKDKNIKFMVFVKKVPKFYYDCDNEKQFYDDWCIKYIEEYKERVIVLDEYSNLYEVWSTRYNRPYSRIADNNEYIPVRYTTINEVRKAIDKMIIQKGV